MGYGTACRPIMSVIILVSNTSLRGRPNFVNHSYDYRPNWTPLRPITSINQDRQNFLECDCWMNCPFLTNFLQ